MGEIRLCDSAEKWDSFVNQAQGSTVFHLWEWLKVMEAHTSSKLYPLIYSNGENPSLLLPLFLKKKGPFTMVMSPPGGVSAFYLGPILLDEGLKQSKKETLLSEFEAAIDQLIFKELKASFVRIRAPPGFDDPRNFIWSGYAVEPMYNYEINLSKGKESIFDNFRGDLKKRIKDFSGIDFLEGGEKELSLIHASLSGRFAEQDISLRVKKEFLLDLYSKFGGKQMRVFFASKDNVFLDGIIATCFNGKFSLWLSAGRQDNDLYTNDFLRVKSIEWAIEKGFNTYEITMAEDERINKYKSKFNPTLTMCFSAEKYSSRLLSTATKASKIFLRGPLT